MITAFSIEFIKLKDKQWTAFHKRLGQEHVPDEFAEIVAEIETFIQPVITALYTGEVFIQKWSLLNEWTPWSEF